MHAKMIGLLVRCQSVIIRRISLKMLFKTAWLSGIFGFSHGSAEDLIQAKRRW